MKTTKNEIFLSGALIFTMLCLLGLMGCPTPPETVFDGAVSGTVSDEVSGDPISGVTVELRQGGETIQTTSTGSDGNYKLTDQVKGEEFYIIRASATGYHEKVIDQFALNSGIQTKEADIKLTPKTPELVILYDDGQTVLNIQGGVFKGTVSIKNNGEGDLVYTDLGTPSWMTAQDEDGNKQGTIAGNGGSETITITVDALEVQSFLTNGTVSGQVSIDTDQQVSGDKVISVKFTYVAENQPPSGGEINITPSTGPYLMRQQITFEAINLEDDNDPAENLKVSWQFEDGQGFSNPTTNKSITHLYQTSGTFQLVLKIIDTEGLESTVATAITISQNQNPSGGSFQIDLAAAELYLNTEIVFTAVSWTDDQLDELTELSYSWDFGDGTTTQFSPSNISISHAFDQPSTYSVSLSVRDKDGGVGMASNTFVIKPVANPEVSTLSISSSSVGSNYVLVSGEVTSIGNGSSGLDDHGFVLGTTTGATTTDYFKIVQMGYRQEVGEFSSRIEGLAATTTYFIRSFAVNESGNVVYGNERDFRTTIPVGPNPVSIYQITSITETTAIIQVDINNSGIGISIDEVGVIANDASSGNPSLEDDQYELREFNTNPQEGLNSINLSGLLSGKTYRVRAYIRSNSGSVMSTVLTFTTK